MGPISKYHIVRVYKNAVKFATGQARNTTVTNPFIYRVQGPGSSPALDNSRDMWLYLQSEGRLSNLRWSVMTEIPKPTS